MTDDQLRDRVRTAVFNHCRHEDDGSDCGCPCDKIVEDVLAVIAEHLTPKGTDLIPIGSLWRDNDRRMSSGNRVVRVLGVTNDVVTYANRHSMKLHNKSRYDRFLTAFTRIDDDQ